MENDLVSIGSGATVNKKALMDFYKKKFPYRLKFLKNHWQWLYNTSLNNQLPRVICVNNEVVGHASGRPFAIKVNEKLHPAQWFVDFAVDAAYRGHGYGMQISKDYEDSGADIHLAVPMSEGSTYIFLKNGWKMYPTSDMHFLVVKPFNHQRLKEKVPDFIRKAGNSLLKPLMKLFYKSKAAFFEDIIVEGLNSKNISHFVDSQKKGKNILTTYRSNEFLQWRYLDSPDLKYYRYFEVKGTNQKAILKIKNNTVAVMLHTEPLDDAEYIKLNASVAYWAANEGLDYIIIYNTVNERRKLLKKKLLSLKSIKRYAYFSKNKELMNFLENSEHYWDFADSDFETFT